MGIACISILVTHQWATGFHMLKHPNVTFVIKYEYNALV
jgi:hypothetical protein